MFYRLISLILERLRREVRAATVLYTSHSLLTFLIPLLHHIEGSKPWPYKVPIGGLPYSEVLLHKPHPRHGNTEHITMVTTCCWIHRKEHTLKRCHSVNKERHLKCSLIVSVLEIYISFSSCSVRWLYMYDLT